MKPVLFILFILFGLVLHAQELNIKSFVEQPSDLSARTNQRVDNNGNECALIKVHLAANEAKFEGNIMGDIAYKTSEYWVYLPKGSKRLTIKLEKYLPLNVQFQEFGVSSLESKTTYLLIVTLPKTHALPILGSIEISSVPNGADVLIDGNKIGTTPLSRKEITLGIHKLTISKNGYNEFDSTFVIKENEDFIVDAKLLQYKKILFGNNVQKKYIDHSAYLFVDAQHQPLTNVDALYRTSAEQGDAASQCAMGFCYAFGIGVKKSMSEAVSWYEKAAKQGDVLAICNLGDCYKKGKGIYKSEAEAVKHYSIAAEKGSAVGYFKLADCYRSGCGVTKSYSEAVKLYRKAADKDYAHAQFMLGLCYYEGIELPKSDSEAAKYFRKAAEQGNSLAQYQLYFLYKDGRGVPKSNTEAMKWLQKAASQGLSQAVEILENL